ncbi:hypothetical protein ETB97_004277 [Aspergillus alliaceus]|uniref:Amidohydrolase-related domain-containing protein n=1 Tax=Petromyces alliaceus TaxID=209559 RepID=A0A8H6A065_PETAA|nr:hypothetical protein ETB97_004277 [Aspergillus burnettii]
MPAAIYRPGHVYGRRFFSDRERHHKREGRELSWYEATSCPMQGRYTQPANNIDSGTCPMSKAPPTLFIQSHAAISPAAKCLLVSLSISIPELDEKVSCPTTRFPRYIPTLALSNFRTLRLYSLGRGSATLSVDTTSNVAPDYLSQTRLALQLQRLLDNDMAHVSRKGLVKLDLGVRDVLNWATHNGSDAVGTADQIGTLAPGKRADLIFIS